MGALGRTAGCARGALPARAASPIVQPCPCALPHPPPRSTSPTGWWAGSGGTALPKTCGSWCAARCAAGRACSWQVRAAGAPHRGRPGCMGVQAQHCRDCALHMAQLLLHLCSPEPALAALTTPPQHLHSSVPLFTVPTYLHSSVPLSTPHLPLHPPAPPPGDLHFMMRHSFRQYGEGQSPSLAPSELATPAGGGPAGS